MTIRYLPVIQQDGKVALMPVQVVPGALPTKMLTGETYTMADRTQEVAGTIIDIDAGAMFNIGSGAMLVFS